MSLRGSRLGGREGRIKCVRVMGIDFLEKVCYDESVGCSGLRTPSWGVVNVEKVGFELVLQGWEWGCGKDCDGIVCFRT